MVKIGLLSDTHGSIHPRLSEFFKDCVQIWHAGDIGNIETADKLAALKPLLAVYGNIDGQTVRQTYPETLIFYTEQVKVMMTHIGGYPGRYEKGVREKIMMVKPKIFISGHSHILKVMYDKKYDLLHINPGAAGNSGLHKSITMIRFVIDGSNIRDLEVLDLPRSVLP